MLLCGGRMPHWLCALWWDPALVYGYEPCALSEQPQSSSG